MKNVVKKHTAPLAMLFLIVMLCIATYIANQREVSDQDLFVTLVLVLVSAVLMVRAFRAQHKAEQIVPDHPPQLKAVEIAPFKVVYIGTAHDFKTQGEDPLIEMVSLAAMQDYYGMIYAAQAPLDHATIRHWFNRTYTRPIHNYGWITNTGRYVDEEEAWDIASKSQQLHQTGQSNGYLTAEEIWPNVYPQKAA